MHTPVSAPILLATACTSLKPAPTRLLLTGSVRSPLPRAVGSGGVNSTLFHGDLHWVPVKRPLYWEVQLDSVKVGEVVAGT